MIGHKGRVNAVAPHSSGRVALSVGRDQTLRLWDLTKGRQAFVQKLPAGEARSVLWSQDCSCFFVLYDSHVGVHEGASGAEVSQLRPSEGTAVGALSSTPRLHSMLLMQQQAAEVLAVACEGGDVLLWQVKGLGGAAPAPGSAASSGSGAAAPSPQIAPTAVLRTGHEKRVRALALLPAPVEEKEGAAARKGISSSSKGAAAAAAAAAAGAREEEEEEEEEQEEEEQDGKAAPQKGFARLSAEAASFALPASSSHILATVGGDGAVLLWAAAPLCAAGSSPALSSSGKPKGAAPAAQSRAAPPVELSEATGTAPLARLKAALNTRPTALAAAPL